VPQNSARPWSGRSWEFPHVAYGDRPGGFPVIYVPFWQSSWPGPGCGPHQRRSAAITKSVAARRAFGRSGPAPGGRQHHGEVVDVAPPADRFQPCSS